MQRIILPVCFLLLSQYASKAQHSQGAKVTLTKVGMAWSGNSVNAVVFRKNSIASFGGVQFIAYYDNEGRVVLGKRNIADTLWELKQTPYAGNTRDAHNSISIAVDGEGFLHMAWDQHNNGLHYCKSVSPFSLELSAMMPMTGRAEKKVSYPEFYLQPSGNLLFFYRDGASGNGNLMLNTYSISTKKWERLQDNLIDGEGKRNAYWQACVDAAGSIHVSWVWRETADVATNHDMSYAKSTDGGKTWQTSAGRVYTLPINISSAEKIAAIPQQSELINQTSMCTDQNGNPIIAGYWKGTKGVPQYQLIYFSKGKWKIKDTGFRSAGFTLSGEGTKRIPMSRPQVISWGSGRKTNVAIIFRDREMGNGISIARNRLLKKAKWITAHLLSTDVGEWEPSFDTELWKTKNWLHLYTQRVTQADKEGIMQTPQEMVQVLEWRE
jgi:hypothetical protein